MSIRSFERNVFNEVELEEIKQVRFEKTRR